MRARRSHAPTCCGRARARVRVCNWVPTHARPHMRARSVGVDRGWLGSQAFYQASAFNANIGAWSTARVTMLWEVCAAFSARAARHGAGGIRSAGRRCGADRCAPTCCVRARARVRVRDWAPMHPRRHMRARCVGVDRGWLGSQAFYSAKAFNSDIGAWNTARATTLSYVCAAFSAAHMRACSVGVDRGWLGSQAFYQASAFNANIGAWNTASVSNMQSVCAAFSAAPARHRSARRVVDAARAVVRGGTADARARGCVRRRVGTRIRGRRRV
jgi:hypothetical protein